jgi:hypothetical protein
MAPQAPADSIAIMVSNSTVKFVESAEVHIR